MFGQRGVESGPTFPAPGPDATEILHSEGLRVAVLDPDPLRRNAIVSALRPQPVATVTAFPACPRDPDEIRWLLAQGFDLLLAEIESTPDLTLEAVRQLCALSSVTVILYAIGVSEDCLMRTMRAGAREYLPYPFSPALLGEALARTAIRLQREPPPPLRKPGQILAFTGSKGGVGVTTVCANFAIALAHQTARRTLLIDLDLPLGDIALVLRINSDYSIADALHEQDRIDSNFFSRLLAPHDSGLMVLPSPGRSNCEELNDCLIARLLTLACLEFDYVVVDAGIRADSVRRLLYDRAQRIYLVTQIGVSELRNSNRLISGSLTANREKLSIVLNRYSARKTPIDDLSIERALTVPIAWRIPNDFHALLRMQNDAIPLIEGDSPVALALRQMAQDAAGIKPEPRRFAFSLFHRPLRHQPA